MSNQADVWSGAAAPNAVGDIVSTCNNWTSAAYNSSGDEGNPGQDDTWFYKNGVECSSTFPVYCVEN